ncbi:MAG: hypothetical protein LBO69_05250 [Ignavibacteria bacterium]|jgi:hypothetical protein|nr:hypothetical protein [Ignavibacteria bacterium]
MKILNKNEIRKNLLIIACLFCIFIVVGLVLHFCEPNVVLNTGNAAVNDTIITEKEYRINFEFIPRMYYDDRPDKEKFYTTKKSVTLGCGEKFKIGKEQYNELVDKFSFIFRDDILHPDSVVGDFWKWNYLFDKDYDRRAFFHSYDTLFRNIPGGFGFRYPNDCILCLYIAVCAEKNGCAKQSKVLNKLRDILSYHCNMQWHSSMGLGTAGVMVELSQTAEIEYFISQYRDKTMTDEEFQFRKYCLISYYFDVFPLLHWWYHPLKDIEDEEEYNDWYDRYEGNYKRYTEFYSDFQKKLEKLISEPLYLYYVEQYLDYKDDFYWIMEELRSYTSGWDGFYGRLWYFLQFLT